ncbi:hypothetical protein BDY19DRAFT_941064 [Irpex rosettiformis]|uniref:Uncharacterized protein n=1 Tax=Irpex rosettiformis TaxID=378272 RepID=A0ACB8U658_9APHY|nr:hypothetical protein BDY19DRAFT_941064 [Irpex rosettiformis]
MLVALFSCSLEIPTTHDPFFSSSRVRPLSYPSRHNPRNLQMPSPPSPRGTAGVDVERC